MITTHADITGDRDSAMNMRGRQGRRPALSPLEEQTMTRFSIVSAAVATFGLLMIGGGDVAFAQTKTTTNTAQCFTDDGYGRIGPAASASSRANRAGAPAKTATSKTPTAGIVRAPRAASASSARSRRSDAPPGAPVRIGRDPVALQALQESKLPRSAFEFCRPNGYGVEGAALRQSCAARGVIYSNRRPVSQSRR